MADAVTTQTIFDSPQRVKVHWTNVSDGTGETNVKKLDISTLKVAAATSAGAAAAPLALDIEEVRWNMQGFTNVKITWDHTTDDTALVLAGSGYDDFRNNGDPRDAGTISALRDPRSTGGDGSILLTTVGAAAAATYDISVIFRKRPQ